MVLDLNDESVNVCIGKNKLKISDLGFQLKKKTTTKKYVK